MAKKNFSFYPVSVLLTMLVLPLIFIGYQTQVIKQPLSWLIAGKWFVFWSVGVRLFIAGLKQVMHPAFTAKEIFHFTSKETHVVIRELGFANIAIGLTGILSLIKTQWISAAAITGGLYFGLAGILHIVKRPESRNEVIAMISDLFIFLVMMLYLINTR